MDNQKNTSEELTNMQSEAILQKEKGEKLSKALENAEKELVLIKEENKQSEANLKNATYARNLIEACLDPLVTINVEGKIMDVNNASIHATGISREDLIGTYFSSHFTEPIRARNVYLEVFKNGNVSDYPLTIKNVNGELTDLMYNASTFKDDEGIVLGVFAVARNFSEQKRISNELIEAKVFAELAATIAEDAQSKAEVAKNIAENAVKSKQQFLSNMSHEIRTPMNAIIGFTKVLLKTELSDKQKDYLSAIKVSGDALIVLINDILDLAKVDAGKMTFELVPFKLTTSIAATLHLFEAKIQEKNLELIKEYDTKIPKVLIGDPIRLHQIILNLVSNAVKFTTKGTITVSVNLLREDDRYVTIEFAISDTGIGIPESKVEKIFESFQQATSDTSRIYGGTGLGLAIVKQLIETQGGTLDLKSQPFVGSTFSFIMSFQKSSEEMEEEIDIVELESEYKDIKVLVVEDITLNQLLMKTLLDDFGFERDIAGNGKIAIEKLGQKSFDIILMDLQMPEMNGFEATEYIRNQLHSNIPIIALTADVTTVDLEKCKAVGMDDYISKPVDERILYNKIVNLVRKVKMQVKINEKTEKIKLMTEGQRYVDLAYLSHRTKSDPKLMLEMIEAYLEQTPPLVLTMKKSFEDKDWSTLQAAVHKMIPSFSIVGMNPDYENIAKKIQEYASTQLETERLHEMVLKLETACSQACKELEVEYNQIKLIKREE